MIKSLFSVYETEVPFVKKITCDFCNERGHLCTFSVLQFDLSLAEKLSFQSSWVSQLPYSDQIKSLFSVDGTLSLEPSISLGRISELPIVAIDEYDISSVMSLECLKQIILSLCEEFDKNSSMLIFTEWMNLFYQFPVYEAEMYAIMNSYGVIVDEAQGLSFKLLKDNHSLESIENMIDNIPF